jgi:signal peptidase I
MMVANMRPSALAEWAFNLIVLVFATSTIAQPFVIPSGSMESTLMTGDHVIVDKLAYAPSDGVSSHLLPYEPMKRGDIVVFRYPVDERQNYIKRAMGFPGDHIRLQNGIVWRNGIRLDEKYVQHVFGFAPDQYRDNFPQGTPRSGELDWRAEQMLESCVQAGELIVPPGKYFVMGDNRDNSLDSRYWGFVPEENIVGKPVLVWWSYEASEKELTDFVNFGHVLDVATHFFTKTRWDRTMRFVRTTG